MSTFLPLQRNMAIMMSTTYSFLEQAGTQASHVASCEDQKVEVFMDMKEAKLKRMHQP